jgi:rhamnogalacturonyl hydrolase YesR
LAAGPIHRVHSDPRHLPAVRQVCEHIFTGSLRLEGGVIAHGGRRANDRVTVWVDTLYYTASVLAEGYRLTGEPRYAAEALHQCIEHARFLQDVSGLFFHDVNPAIDGTRSPAFWSRGNGWIMMALADTLRACPQDSPGWSEVMKIYRALVTGLFQLQHSCGLWRIVPECDEAHLEPSGSAMILTGLAIGLSSSWLEPQEVARLDRGLRELLTWITPEGTLVGAQYPAGLGGWETHKLSELGERTYATGALLRLLAESQILVRL